MNITHQSKRKYNSNYTSSPTLHRNNSLNAVNDLKLSGCGPAYSTYNTSIELWELHIQWMLPHNGCILLPIASYACDDMAFVIGKDWELLLSILI